MYVMYRGFEMVRYPLAVRYKRARDATNTSHRALHDTQLAVNMTSVSDSFSEQSQTPDVAVAAADDDDNNDDHGDTHLSNEMPAETVPAVTSEPGTPTVLISVHTAQKCACACVCVCMLLYVQC